VRIATQDCILDVFRILRYALNYNHHQRAGLYSFKGGVSISCGDLFLKGYRVYLAADLRGKGRIYLPVPVLESRSS
jgi:hypothetical protein